MSPKKGETGRGLSKNFQQLYEYNNLWLIEKYTHLQINLVFARDSPGTQLNLSFVMISGN
ncbi:hypothetical protein CSKR_106122 [Clonorchis sinensis]|uniref:Uncharacterized protein n=1 Tax=Clonorchis sinensis TaxID=79923 RepID=A0A3R7CP63_CLOSI|nr:hypothetical protein CSKR_106122 [Clonorchis sinensis]